MYRKQCEIWKEDPIEVTLYSLNVLSTLNDPKAVCL